MIAVKNIPELRFPEFEGEWGNDKIGRIFQVNAGGDIDKEYVRFEKDEIYKYPVYANAEAKKGLYGYSNIYKIEAGTLTVAGRGVNIGITHYRDHRFYPIVRLLVLKPKINIDLLFFEYQINRSNIFVESTGVPQLTAPQLSGYHLAYPKKPEQQKIASFLSSVDQRIHLLTQKKVKLEQYKKGVMQQIFSQQVRFKDENGQDYPEWEVKRLGDIGTILKGKGISKDDITIDGHTECIRYGELYTFYRETIYTTISKTNRDPKELILSKKHDVIIPASGETQIDIAKASCVMRDGIALGGDLNIIRTDIDGVYLTYYINGALKYEIAKAAQGISVIHLYGSQLKELRIKLPNDAEQQKIASFLSSIDEKINHIKSQTELTRKWKKGLLQKMFV